MLTVLLEKLSRKHERRLVKPISPKMRKMTFTSTVGKSSFLEWIQSCVGGRWVLLQISSQRANKTEKILLEVIFQLTCSSTDIP